MTLLPCCLQVYGRGAGIAATAAAMLRGHGTAAFTRLTPPPPTATGLVATRVGRSPLRCTRPSVSRLDEISGIILLKLVAPHLVSPAARARATHCCFFSVPNPRLSRGLNQQRSAIAVIQGRHDGARSRQSRSVPLCLLHARPDSDNPSHGRRQGRGSEGRAAGAG